MKQLFGNSFRKHIWERTKLEIFFMQLNSIMHQFQT